VESNNVAKPRYFGDELILDHFLVDV
jgi:hypothetical protein